MTGNSPELRNCGSKNECYAPVNRDDPNPKELSRSCGKLRQTQQFLENVLIHDLDPDISIQSSGYKGRQECEDVARGQGRMRKHTLVQRVSHIAVVY